MPVVSTATPTASVVPTFLTLSDPAEKHAINDCKTSDCEIFRPKDFVWARSLMLLDSVKTSDVEILILRPNMLNLSRLRKNLGNLLILTLFSMQVIVV
jgi:hypothetical protein